MGVANKRYSKILKVNWAVISVMAAFVSISEILWIRFFGIPLEDTFWFRSLPIPILAFVVTFFMWSMSSFRKKRNVLTGVQLAFSGVALAITLMVTMFWIDH